MRVGESDGYPAGVMSIHTHDVRKYADYVRKLTKRSRSYADNVSKNTAPVSQCTNSDSSNAHYVSEITYILGYHTNWYSELAMLFRILSRIIFVLNLGRNFHEWQSIQDKQSE